VDLGEGIVKEIDPSTTSNKSSIPQSSTVTILDARSSDSADAVFGSPTGLARRVIVVADTAA